jgi:Lipase maturation factor
VADEELDLRPPPPWAALARWLGPPRGYGLTRWCILRLLGIVYVFAFVGLILQGPGLLGSHGLTPVARYLAGMHGAGRGFWDLPSVFWWSDSDTALAVWAYAGLAIALAVALGWANLPMLLALWAIYGSFVRVGQTWFGFGWEIQILETTLIAAFLAHPWDPRPLAARPPPLAAIVLMRWLVFRIMLGAGLIKLRGSPCWIHLTCLDYHFETQPIPNPLSPLFHHAPHVVHAAGVLFNDVVEVLAPWFVFGPRRARLAAGCLMAAFQLTLIASGNLAFLNWLTLVPILACFDDDALRRVMPRRLREYAGARACTAAPRRGHRIAAGCFAALVAYKSLPVIANLASHHQAMNKSYDRLALVNTYGAFGSVDKVRHELVIEGTMDPDPATARWRAYELPCKPGDLARRPCVLGPYHLRLDWLIWFAAMEDEPEQAWELHLVWELLDGEPAIRTLLAVDPFDGKPPRWVRIRRFVYHLAPYRAPTWWTRDGEELWLAPVSLDTPDLRALARRFGWPMPRAAD